MTKRERERERREKREKDLPFALALKSAKPSLSFALCHWQANGKANAFACAF
jgi:hypothetical protein